MLGSIPSSVSDLLVFRSWYWRRPKPIQGKQMSHKCFIINAHEICARWTRLEKRLLNMSCWHVSLHNVRYANNSPVYHSISWFDRFLEMACSTFDSGIVFCSKIIQTQTTIIGQETLCFRLWTKYLTWKWIKGRQRIIKWSFVNVSVYLSLQISILPCSNNGLMITKLAMNNNKKDLWGQ